MFYIEGEQKEIVDGNSLVLKCLNKFINIYALNVLFIVITLIIFLPILEVLLYILLFFVFDNKIVSEINWKPKIFRYQHFFYAKVTSPNLDYLKFRMPIGYIILMYFVTYIVFVMFIFLYKQLVLERQLGGNNINYYNEYIIAMIVSAVLFITFLILFSSAFQ